MESVGSDPTYQEALGEMSFVMRGGSLGLFIRVSPGDTIDGSIDPGILPKEMVSVYFAKLRKGNVGIEDTQALQAFLTEQKRAVENLERFVRWYGNVVNAIIGYRQMGMIEECST